MTKTDTKHEALWNSTLTTVFLGYSFTFSEKLKADMVVDALVFVLDGVLDYGVFLHEPHYHHFVSNPLVYRGTNMQSRFEWLYISLTLHEKLRALRGGSKTRQVGCRPPWDPWSPPALPLCVNTEQLRQHEELDWNNFNYEQKIIINNTGCLLPVNIRSS